MRDGRKTRKRIIIGVNQMMQNSILPNLRIPVRILGYELAI